MTRINDVPLNQMSISKLRQYQREIAIAINKATCFCPNNLKKRFEHLCEMVVSCGGFDASIKGRENLRTISRAMVVTQLIDEGYRAISIERVCGVNHVMSSYYKKMMGKMLSQPRWYTAELSIWREFQNRLDDEYESENEDFDND